VELGRPDDAAVLLLPVLSRYPEESSRESALYWSDLATAYARAGEFDGAREALDKARDFAARVHSPRADLRVSQAESSIIG
jgi:Flp pilus assembly protein TadD